MVLQPPFGREGLAADVAAEDARVARLAAQRGVGRRGRRGRRRRRSGRGTRGSDRRRDGRPLRDLEGLLDLLEGRRAAALVGVTREGLPVVGPAHVLGRRVSGHAQRL